MINLISGFDHPILAVSDMQLARAAFERLGFTVPPRGSHREWGTGNWCIMFPHDYLELRGIVDPTRYLHGLEEFLARREGLMGIAFASDADATNIVRSLRDRGLHPAEPRELTRNFELPEGAVHPRFRLTFFDAGETDCLMASLVCQHLTPQLIRRPDFLVHPNSGVGVSSITAVTRDLERARELLEKYFGDIAPSASGEVLIPMGEQAVLRVLGEKRAAEEQMALSGVDAPYLSAVGIRVRSREQCEHALRAGGVEYATSAGGALRVEPVHACGVVCEFVEDASH
jgi:catechol 2,3-dioxygenase-like lactoylglutathione lyase family enzyme